MKLIVSIIKHIYSNMINIVEHEITSIITINYNSSEFTIKLVRKYTLNINSLNDYEIILTDNASHENYDYKMLTSSSLPK